MTQLDKPVRRKTRGAYPVLYARPRQIVVTLMPGDLIEFREAGRRARYTAPIDQLFKRVVIVQAQAVAAEKRKQRNLRRKAARHGA